MQALPNSMRGGTIDDLLDLITNPDKYKAALKELTELQTRVRADLGLLKTKEEAEKLLARAVGVRDEADNYAGKKRVGILRELAQAETANTKVAVSLDKAKKAEVIVRNLQAEYETKLSVLASDKMVFEDKVKKETAALAKLTQAHKNQSALLAEHQKVWHEKLAKVHSILGL